MAIQNYNFIHTQTCLIEIEDKQQNTTCRFEMIDFASANAQCTIEENSKGMVSVVLAITSSECFLIF